MPPSVPLFLISFYIIQLCNHDIFLAFQHSYSGLNCIDIMSEFQMPSSLYFQVRSPMERSFPLQKHRRYHRFAAVDHKT